MKLFQLYEATTSEERKEWLILQDQLEELVDDKWDVSFNYIDGIFSFKSPGKVKIEKFEFDYLDEIEDDSLIDQVKGEFKGVHQVEIETKHNSLFELTITFNTSQDLIMFMHQYFLGEDHAYKVPTKKSLLMLDKEYDLFKILKNVEFL